MESRIIKKRINRVCFAIFIFIGILTVLQLGVSLAEMFLLPIFDEKIKLVLSIIGSFSYVIAYFVPVAIFKKVYSKDYVSIKTAPRMGAHPISMILASLSVCLAASHFWSYISSGDGDVQIYHGESIVLLMISTVLVPAFCEELFFRGLIMTNLMPLGRNFAIIASGIIFGLVHGNHDQIFFATVAGIAFGFIYAETGSIWCGVVAHMLNNFIAIAETVLWGTLKTGTAIKINVVIEALIMLCGVISIIYLLKIRKNENREVTDAGCFGTVSEKLLDGGVRYSVSEYLKGFFSPAMIAFLCYVAVNEVTYVFLF